MYRFPVKVERRGESFVVIVPAVPGCVTSGRSREEALGKAREVLRVFLMQAGPGFSPAASPPLPPSDGAGGEYVEVTAPALQPC